MEHLTSKKRSSSTAAAQQQQLRLQMETLWNNAELFFHQRLNNTATIEHQLQFVWLRCCVLCIGCSQISRRYLSDGRIILSPPASTTILPVEGISNADKLVNFKRSLTDGGEKRKKRKRRQSNTLTHTLTKSQNKRRCCVPTSGAVAPALDPPKKNPKFDLHSAGIGL